MIRDTDYDAKALEEYLQTDSIQRNEYLENFLKTLATIDKNTYISVDANWGAGKTVFMKQLELLNYRREEEPTIPGISTDTLAEYQDKYLVFYYNAWENDHHGDPLESLLFSLIEDFYKSVIKADRVSKLMKQAATTIVTGSIRAATKGIVDFEKIKNVSTLEDLASKISEVNQRKNAVSEVINAILPAGMKLLIIVDELDRCNPEFGVKLMEVAKHYYNDDNIVFIVSTNNRQLVHTIKKYYGDGFDGYGYLDKLFDIILELPRIDIDHYFHAQLGVGTSGDWSEIIPVIIAKQLDMTMREANRFVSMYELIRKRTTRMANWNDPHPTTLLIYLVFIPLALALKTKNIALHDAFLAGKPEAAELVDSLFGNSEDMQRFAVQYATKVVTDAPAIVKQAYKDFIFSKQLVNDHQDRSYYRIKEAVKDFREILPLLSSVGTIDTPNDQV